MNCLMTELLEWWVKSLAICNVVTESLDTLCFSHRHTEIAVTTLVAPALLLGGKAHLVQGRNVLTKLLLALISKDRQATTADRAWSFSRNNKGLTSVIASTTCVQPVSLSLKLTRSWSVAK